ncbi:grpE protein homolog 1, mitochondrial [Macrosteles quadrilineatus]|uniref:grpE protein homolog 1, mitochondrial n=1 Tax=Macrosteles quadrilineatus TaxID=74068 RepID=UPI0023E2A45F|nr:grpE protein homolog 1, mitochondrial [Macrosteles quadrilineatus]
MSSSQVCYKFGRLIFGNSRNLQGRIRIFGSANGRRLLTTAPEEKTSAEKEESKKSDLNEAGLKMEELLKQVETLTDDKKSLEDKYKRALADAENTRRIKMTEVEKAKNFAIQGFCKDLIEVADTLNKATECVPKEEISEEKNPHLKNLYDGLVLTENILQKVFQKHGLAQCNPMNEPFDPNFHEALFQQEVEGKPPNLVVVVSKIGYTLNGRCIRPALVAVSKEKSA